MDDKFKNFIIKFLKRHFPITKIKKSDSTRFHRGIYIHNGFTGKEDRKFYMSDKKDLNDAYAELFKILENVFGIGAKEINPILLQHLNLL